MSTSRTAAGCLCLALAIGAIVAACGGGSNPSATTAVGPTHGTLTVYSDLPVNSASALEMSSIENGELLALDEAHNRVGAWRVQLALRYDGDPGSGAWSPGATAAQVHGAAADASAVAYIGDFDSGATAVSLPVTSASDMLQISPWSPYIGFTDVNPANDKGDPARYYPNGDNTFARLVPSDLVQAEATVEFMRSRGVSRLYVLSDVSDPFDADIASLVANAAPSAGIFVVADQSLDTVTNTQAQGYAAIANAVAAQRADAVLLGGKPGPGALALWTELHMVLPHVKLFAPSTLATSSFLAALGPAAAATYVTSPILELRQYPAAGQRILKAYEHRFGIAANAYALYGYDAMRIVLDAIGRARHPAARGAVRAAFFKLGRIRGGIGTYRFSANGDTSLTTLDGYRVTASGALVRLRTIRVPAPPLAPLASSGGP